MTFEAAMKRYLSDVTPTKRPLTQSAEKNRAGSLVEFFGKYSLAAITTELIAQYRDARLAGNDRMKEGEAQPRAANTVRLDLALLGHLFTVAVKEWGLGLPYNPVLNLRRSPRLGQAAIAALAVRKKSPFWPPSISTPIQC